MDVIFPSTMCAARRSRGYTLVELMMGLALSAILFGFALPGLGTLLDDSRLSGQANIFAGHLNYARTEAIKTGERTVVCKSPDGESCDNHADWHEGWIVFIDNNSDRSRQATEPLLRVAAPDDDSITIDYGAFPSDNYVVYYPTGRSLGNGTFTFCDAHDSVEPRALVLYKTGRLRSADIMPDGSELSCL